MRTADKVRFETCAVCSIWVVRASDFPENFSFVAYSTDCGWIYLAQTFYVADAFECVSCAHSESSACVKLTFRVLMEMIDEDLETLNTGAECWSCPTLKSTETNELISSVIVHPHVPHVSPDWGKYQSWSFVAMIIQSTVQVQVPRSRYRLEWTLFEYPPRENFDPE